MDFGAVATWRPVSSRWVRYRPEPLVHERSWGCEVDADAGEPWRSEGGFDADGRPIAIRHFSPDGELIDPKVAVRSDDALVLFDLGGEVARTELDASGRPLRTTYPEDDDERYEYDEHGRLVVIHDENVEMYEGPRFWLASGGVLSIEYDGEDVARITGEYGTVWERPTRSWDEELREGADTIAARCLELTREVCAAEAVPPGTEVFGLTLNYVDQGSLHFSMHYGLEADRRAWLAEGRDPEDLAIKLLYLVGNDGLGFIDEDTVPSKLDDRLLRSASINHPGDPYRTVLGEVARRLATTSFEPMLRKTDDFVVFVAEHDEGIAPKVRSIREHNPHEQVARWEASWPAGAPRGEDEPF